MINFFSRAPLFACAVCFAVQSTACGPPRPLALVDLTYAFGEETVYWPTNQPFHWEKTDWGMTAGGYWYASANFSASEHGGTHMDAPIHFGQGRRTIDEIPLDRLIGPAVVIDVRSQCRNNPDYMLTADDVKRWEAQHGPIPTGALVFMFSGWGERWPNRSRYLGSETSNNPRTLHFPGFSSDAADFLIHARTIHGIGIDTASIDPGLSRDFPVHRLVNDSNVYALENVAALDQLPPRGATVYALPMKIKGGTGGPVRIIAWVPQRRESSQMP
jgi:kynurenine formamidase